MGSDDKIYLVTTLSNRVQVSIISFSSGLNSFTTTLQMEFGSVTNSLVASSVAYDTGYTYLFFSGSSNGHLSLTKIYLPTGTTGFTYYI